MIDSDDWVFDCKQWRGRILTGKYGHWCYDWDFLPIDETTPEWPCACAQDLMRTGEIEDGDGKHSL